MNFKRNNYLVFKNLKSYILNRKSPGFTLIELLVVITIIGILSAGLISAINPALYFNRAKDSQKLQLLPQIKSGLEVYYNLTKKYPASLSDLTTSGTLKALPGCTDDPACFIYLPDLVAGQWAVTFVKLSVAKEPGASSRCSLEAIHLATPPCLPVNFTSGNWVCAVSGSVNCTKVTEFSLP